MKLWITAVLLSTTVFAQGTKHAHVLTLTGAQRILNQQIDQATVQNTLLTCHACFDPDDKAENDNAPIVSTFSPEMDQFLLREGYIEAARNPQTNSEVFTAKAKRSKYYGYNNQAPGLRLANFKNPRILTTRITDPRHVPIQYDLVPNEITAAFFGKVQTVRTTASFSYEDGSWTVCIGCRR